MKKILLLCLFFLTGCIKYNDLKELTIIKSIGISYNEKYTIYAQIIDHIDEVNNPSMQVIKAEGKTIQDGFNNLKDNINKEIFISHIDLMVLNPNLDNKQYQEIIDYFVNNNFRNDFYCIYSSDINTLLENSKYDEIEILLKTNKNKKMIVKTFDNLLKEYLDSNTIILPNITYQDKIKYLGNYQYHKEDKDV